MRVQGFSLDNNSTTKQPERAHVGGGRLHGPAESFKYRVSCWVVVCCVVSLCVLLVLFRIYGKNVCLYRGVGSSIEKKRVLLKPPRGRVMLQYGSRPLGGTATNLGDPSATLLFPPIPERLLSLYPSHPFHLSIPARDKRDERDGKMEGIAG